MNRGPHVVYGGPHVVYRGPHVVYRGPHIVYGATCWVLLVGGGDLWPHPMYGRYGAQCLDWGGGKSYSWSLSIIFSLLIPLLNTKMYTIGLQRKESIRMVRLWFTLNVCIVCAIDFWLGNYLGWCMKCEPIITCS